MDDKELNIYFICPNKYNDVSECEMEMQATFELCCNYVKKCTWVVEKNWKKIGENKSDIAVFESFDGEVFKILRNKKCFRILGYRCLKTLLLEQIPVPNTSSPIFMIPMINMVITCSGFDTSEKRKLEEKILFMGGEYSGNFTNRITHLITNSIKSEKYARACDLKLPIYLSTWVEKVWDENLKSINRADCTKFDDCKCPAFYKLLITSTGFAHKERDMISNLITKNGGIYTGKFESEKTSVVICRNNDSEKFRAAKKNKIDCCTIDWVIDSAKVGYALPMDKYQIQASGIASSTLINEATEIRPSANFSMQSEIASISNSPSPKCISETVLSNLSSISIRSGPKQHEISDSNTRVTRSNTSRTDFPDYLKNFPTLTEIKKAGPFLDGCCVYLATSYEDKQRDKLCKILNLGGAIRYDEISSNVTHLIAPDYNKSEIEKFHAENYHPVVLSVNWILESIKLKCPASEELFLLRNEIPPKLTLSTKRHGSSEEQTPNSPLSKKGVEMLRSNSSMSLASITSVTDLLDKENDTVDDQTAKTISEDIMKEYSQKRTNEQDTLEKMLGAGNYRDFNPIQRSTINANIDLTKEYSEKRAIEQDTLEKMLGANDYRNFNPNQQSTKVQEANVSPHEVLNNSSVANSTANISIIFSDLIFSVIGFDSNTEDDINEMITTMGGKILDPGNFNPFAKSDYTVVPIDGTFDNFNIENNLNEDKLISNLYIEQCYREKELIPVDYYHKPILIPENCTPLANCIVSITVYQKFERIFLCEAIKILGGSAEEILSKKGNKKGLPATTHLICPTPLGTKYTAAKNWGVYIVTHEWLLNCIKERKRVPEDLYKVPESPSTNEIVKNDGETIQKQNDSVEKSTENTKSVENHPMDNFFTKKVVDKKSETDLQPALVCGQSTPKALIPPPPEENTTPLSSLKYDSKKNFNFNMPVASTSKFTPDKNLALNSPLLSQPMTPVAKFLENIGLKNRLNDKSNSDSSDGDKPCNSEFDSPLPNTPTHVDTPEEPLGRIFGDPNPSPSTRKYWAKYINRLHTYDHDPPPAKRQRRKSTPLSELKNRLWRKILPPDYESPELDKNNDSEQDTSDAKESTPARGTVAAQVLELQNMLEKRSASNSASSFYKSRKSLLRPDETHKLTLNSTPIRKPIVIESQNDVIGWEDPLESENSINSINSSTTSSNNQSASVKIRRFMLSQLPSADRPKYIEMIQDLGGLISEQPILFDPESTHLICASLTRNEKLLSSIASGKWILHTSYLLDSKKAGYFLDEELYEYGNPKAITSVREHFGNLQISNAVYRWRKQISATKFGAYHGMKAVIIIHSKREKMKTLIEAGGGIVLNENTDSLKTATHCFIDTTLIKDNPICKQLANDGVYCLPMVFLSDILLSDPQNDPADHIIPALASYFRPKK